MAKTRRPVAEERYPATEPKAEQLEREPQISYPFQFRTPTLTSSTEVLHLVAGSLIVMAVGLSLYGSGLEWITMLFKQPLVMLGSAVVFTVIFVSHELAHKAAARWFGLWAEFRLNLIGVAFTLMTIASPLVKIISPGTVVISGAISQRMLGATALAGPSVSMLFTGLFLALHLYVPVSSLTSALLRAATLSAWIALQNLIPFGMLDGAKILRWSKAVWAVSFAVSAMLLAAAIWSLPDYQQP